MITQIGIIAGEIWSYLESHDKVDQLDGVINGLSRERDLVLMSIGWLAREGHVVLEGEAPNYMVKLTNKKGKEDE
jgi:hypothetical protein